MYFIDCGNIEKNFLINYFEVKILEHLKVDSHETIFLK